MNNPDNPYSFLGLEELEPLNTVNEASQEFLTAVENGDLELVQEWLKNPDADVNAVNSKRETGLYLAVSKNYLEIVKAILKHPKIDVNQPGDAYSGMRPLHCAAERKEIDAVQLLLEHPKIDVNVTDSQGRPTLEYALGRPSFNTGEAVLTEDQLIKHQVALVHLFLNDPRTIPNYNQWLEYAQGIRRPRSRLEMTLYIPCNKNIVTALLKHLRINKNVAGDQLFSRFLKHNDKSILMQTVIAGLDVKASYDTYLASAEAHYADGQRAQALMQTLIQLQESLIQEIQAIFQELGETIDEKAAWTRLQNMPASVAQLKTLKEEIYQSKVDKAHFVLGIGQIRWIRRILADWEIPDIGTLPAELLANIMKAIETDHFDRLTKFIETPFEKDWDRTPLDNPASPRLSM